ncbi:MAG: hypothetical protein JST15_02315 [Bacteroidetes bacterium]|nr:hypothetical protein [Bacteroidota bacterium]
MSKILGLDLGTNSIGWAIRDTETNKENQIIDFGVTVFKKGVGDGKSGEFSLAAERRNNRSKRRLYNAKRYRKWATLKALIDNNMCPLSIEELNLWRIGDWKKGEKNKGRIYPLSSDYLAWLAMDFDRIGKNFSSDIKLKPEFINPYELRCKLLEYFDKDDKNRLYKIGRALYHLVQRRGFKSSRKSGKSTYGENKYFEEKRKNDPNLKASQILTNGLINEKRRIRGSGIIKRDEYINEYKSLIEKQKIDSSISDKLFKAIYYVRPLRGQKGLVGKCTLEPKKPRIPISHPMFEEFRALQFINNIKWMKRNSYGDFEPIPMELKKKIFEDLFFRKSKPVFRFEEINKKYSNNGEFIFNYDKSNPSISACPFIAGLMNVFDEEWSDKFISDENLYGINWNGLIIQYERIKYNNDKSVKSSNSNKLNYEQIWHLLFDFIQTKDNEEDLKRFLMQNFKWDEDKIKLFIGIDIQQGYGSLSKHSINKILPHLQKGNIYTNAVFFANLVKVFRKFDFQKIKEDVYSQINETVETNKKFKDKLNIVNGLIQDYFGNTILNNQNQTELYEKDKNEILFKIRSYLSDKLWKKLDEKEMNDLINFISEKYKDFLLGNQIDEEKASFRPGKFVNKDYYKLPRLDEDIKNMLKDKYKLKDEDLNLLYHPSDIDIYPKENYKLGNPMPPTRGWKNPMAMRTMHELRKLVNYLLEINKIDNETNIVIELARELNDSNLRKAIRFWQNDKETENQVYSKALSEMFQIKSPSIDDYNKFQSAVEQIRIVDSLNEDSYDIELKYFQGNLFLRDNYYECERKNTNSQKKFKEEKTVLKNEIFKYRLWQEQKFQCLYTGRVIPFNQLFGDTNNYQIEHTIPRSISFDSELKNLTVCDSVYNNFTKNNNFPTECPNYYESYTLDTVDGKIECTPIINRVNKLIKPKVDALKERIANLTEANKKIPSWEKDRKDANIVLRHYLRFELNYWQEKLFTFTIKKEDWIDKFKNSQLVDTQLVTKYARAYLKSYFSRVYVQKGQIVSIFREIYGIQTEGSKKKRDFHSHHAVDAAILTLIPGSATRDKQLKDYFEFRESKTNNKSKYKFPIPYEGFQNSHVTQEIEDNILINHISNDRTLTPTKKTSRKRGKIEYLRDKKNRKYLLDNNGNKIKKILTGDSVRGQLHKETFFGAIKVVKRDENGNPIKENGKYIIEKDNDKELLWIVAKTDIRDLKVEYLDGSIFIKDEIVDPILKKFIETQLSNGIELSSVKSFHGDLIRHIRCRVKAGRGYLSIEKAIELKKPTYISKHNHKNYILAQNEENYLYLLYSNETNSVMKCRIVNLFNFIEFRFTSLDDIRKDNTLNNYIYKDLHLNLKSILKVGQKVIFFTESKDEIKSLNKTELIKRLFIIYKFNDMGTPNIHLQNNLKARTNEELGDGDTNFDSSKYQFRLKLKASKMKCIVEHDEFEIKPDGEIIFKF